MGQNAASLSDIGLQLVPSVYGFVLSRSNSSPAIRNYMQLLTINCKFNMTQDSPIFTRTHELLLAQTPSWKMGSRSPTIRMSVSCEIFVERTLGPIFFFKADISSTFFVLSQVKKIELFVNPNLAKHDPCKLPSFWGPFRFSRKGNSFTSARSLWLWFSKHGACCTHSWSYITPYISKIYTLGCGPKQASIKTIWIFVEPLGRPTFSRLPNGSR